MAEWVQPIVKEQSLALKSTMFLDKPPGHASGLLGHAKPNTEVCGIRLGYLECLSVRFHDLQSPSLHSFLPVWYPIIIATIMIIKIIIPIIY